MPKKPKETLPNDLSVFRQAAVYNQQLAERMLAQYPDLMERRNSTGETPLHYCAIEGLKDAVVWLISKGGSVNAPDNSNNTPLIHAAQLGYLEVCKILVEAGADLEAKDSIEAHTALHAAARYGHTEICKLLLEVGALVNSINGDGEHPWDIALPRKRDLVHAILRKHGGKGSGNSRWFDPT